MITRDHPEWPSFKASLLDEIEGWRTRLEDPHQDAAMTAQLRGSIAAYRQLIDRIEPKTVRTPTANYQS